MELNEEQINKISKFHEELVKTFYGIQDIISLETNNLFVKGINSLWDELEPSLTPITLEEKMGDLQNRTPDDPELDKLNMDL